MIDLEPARKPGDASYATVDDWLTASDLPEGEIPIPIAPKAGVVLWVRYRALSLEEQAAAWMAARAARVRLHLQYKLPPPEPDETDFATLVLETIRRGIVSPHLTPEQALALRHKNPKVLQDIYRLIVGAGRFTPEGFEDVVDSILRERTDGRAGATPAGDDGAGAGAVGADDRT